MIVTAFIEGLIWSALWIIYVYIIVRCFPWQLLHDYPEDIQEAATLKKPTDKQNTIARDCSKWNTQYPSNEPGAGRRTRLCKKSGHKIVMGKFINLCGIYGQLCE